MGISNFLKKNCSVFIVKRWHAYKHRMSYDPNRPDVTPCIVKSFYHLRCHVQSCSELFCHEVVWVYFLSASEVNQLQSPVDVPVLVLRNEKYVFWLDVSVHNVIFV